MPATATATPVDELGNEENRGRHALMLAQIHGLIVQFVGPYDLSDAKQAAALKKLLAGRGVKMPQDTGIYDLVHMRARRSGKVYPVLIPEEDAHAWAEALGVAEDPEQEGVALQYRPGTLPTVKGSA